MFANGVAGEPTFFQGCAKKKASMDTVFGNFFCQPLSPTAADTLQRQLVKGLALTAVGRLQASCSATRRARLGAAARGCRR